MSVWYEQAEQVLSEASMAVQAQHAFALRALEQLAAELVESLQRNDELVVEALS